MLVPVLSGGRRRGGGEEEGKRRGGGGEEGKRGGRQNKQARVSACEAGAVREKGRNERSSASTHRASQQAKESAGCKEQEEKVERKKEREKER